MTKVSRASSRTGKADNFNPGGLSVGKSLALCTAKSARPSSKAFSSSLVNKPFPPLSRRDHSACLSPVMDMGKSSTSSSITFRMREATKSACFNASGLFRVAKTRLELEAITLLKILFSPKAKIN
jgi:hypothetical protein